LNDAFNLRAYLHERFLGLELGPALFYRWPIGIRFDLELSQIPQRPIALYEACFGSEDNCVIISLDYDNGGVTPRSHNLFSAAALLKLRFPTGSEVIKTKGDEETSYTLQWVAQPARSFEYAEIFQQLANADHTIEPTIASRVFFLDPIKDLILSMYDDRGMDAIAANRSSLIGMYMGFTDWILDYDRERINRIFNT
jgi:hypothetical protein